MWLSGPEAWLVPGRRRTPDRPRPEPMIEVETVVKVIYRDRTWEIKAGSTVRHVIEKADLNPESILALRDGKLINEATLTKEGDTIKLVSVVSGG
jgi:sulfur carrier protein ThiS